MQNSTADFLPSKALSCSLLDLSAFIFTVFMFILCSYKEIFPFVKHETCFNKQISYRNQCIICGKSVQWSGGTQLLTVLVLFHWNPLHFGGWERGKKKTKKNQVHFCSWKSLVDLINLIVLGIFDIPTCLHTTAATCCHLKSKYRITANWDFIVYHAYFRNYFCKVKMTLTLKACVIKPQQSVCWVCTYYVLIIKRKM